MGNLCAWIKMDQWDSARSDRCAHTIFHSLYEDKVAKERAWSEISEYLKKDGTYSSWKSLIHGKTKACNLIIKNNVFFTVKEVEASWDRLRSHFTRERKFCDRPTGSGPRRNKPWMLYEQISFLDDFVLRRIYVFHISIWFSSLVDCSGLTSMTLPHFYSVERNQMQRMQRELQTMVPPSIPRTLRGKPKNINQLLWLYLHLHRPLLSRTKVMGAACSRKRNFPRKIAN